MRLQNRRGFALPMAIFVIALLTVAVTASFVSASGERRIVDSHEAQVRAYNIAQAALERYMVERVSLFGSNGAPGASELSSGATIKNLTVPVFDGGNDKGIINIFQLRAQVGNDPTQATFRPALYAIRSRAADSKGNLAGTDSAVRTVGQLAMWVPGSLNVLAGWTSLSGLKKNGSAGTLSGTDNCGASTTLAGIAVPTGGFAGNDDAISGNPAIKELGTQEQTNTAVNIDWDAIKNENAIPADYTNAWPAPSMYNTATFWPIIHWTGDAVLQSGRGMLIVDGNLILNGGVTWDGIILVGGNITSNGNNTVYGAIVTGLDQKIGVDVISTEIGNGTKIYQYDSCNVAKATAAMGTIRPLNNTWTDSWTTTGTSSF